MSAAARTLPGVSESTTTDTSKTVATGTQAAETKTSPSEAGAAAKSAPKTFLQEANEVAAVAEKQSADVGTKDGADATKAEGGEQKPPVEVKFPEGLVTADQAKAFTELAAKLELPGEKAQAIADHYAALSTAAAKAAEQAFETQQKTFRAAIESDKELGGANLEATKANCAKALKRFGSPELNELLEAGLGNHPGIVRLLSQIGKASSEDSVAGTTKSTTTNGELTEEQLLRVTYPSMYKES